MTKYLIIKSSLVTLLLLLTLRVTAPTITIFNVPRPAPINPYERLIWAVIQVESKGDTLAFNETEEAIGAFQIRPIRVMDYNERTGKKYKLEDCRNYDLSRSIFLYYAVQAGFDNYETIARRWNGSGKTTLDYWEKVKKHL